MDKTLIRLLAGLLTLAFLAFLLSLVLPSSDEEKPESAPERVVTMDLTQTDSQPQEATPGDAPPPDSMDAVTEPSEAAPDAPAPAIPGEPGASSAPPLETPSQPSATAEPPSPATGPAVPQGEPAGAVPEPVAPRPAPAKDPAPLVPEPRPAPKPAPKPATKPATKPVTKPSAPARAVAPSPGKRNASGNFVVQGGAYSFLDKAESVRAKARALGIGCVVSPGETSRGVVYRLRCGPYAALAGADAAARKLGANGIPAQVIGDPR
ncbi:MAG: SPOR domain-containing protein [Panacagrimonas sp.]